MILTNGNSEMLSQLTINTGLNKLIDGVLSAVSKNHLTEGEIKLISR